MGWHDVVHGACLQPHVKRMAAAAHLPHLFPRTILTTESDVVVMRHAVRPDSIHQHSASRSTSASKRRHTRTHVTLYLPTLPQVYLPEVLTLRIGIAQPPPSGNGAAAINAPGRVSLSLTPPTASGKGASTPERGRLNLGARPGTPERPLPAATPANGITVIELDESEPGYGAKDAGGAACLKPQADAAPCRLSPLHGAAADGGGGWRTTKRQRSGGLDSGGLASLHQRSTTPPPHSPPRSLLQPQTLDPHAPTTRAGHPLPAAAGRQARSPTPPSPKRSRRGSEASPVAASTRAAARSRSPSPAGRGVGGRGMASGGVGVGVSRQAAVLPSGCAPAEAAQVGGWAGGLQGLLLYCVRSEECGVARLLVAHVIRHLSADASTAPRCFFSWTRCVRRWLASTPSCNWRVRGRLRPRSERPW